MKPKQTKRKRSPAISITLSPDSLDTVESLAEGFKTTRSAIINALIPSQEEARGLLSFYKARKPIDYKVPESGFARLSVYGHKGGTGPLEYLAHSGDPAALQRALDQLIPHEYVALAAREFSSEQWFNPAEAFSYCLARELCRRMSDDRERPIGLQVQTWGRTENGTNWIMLVAQLYLHWNEAMIKVKYKSETNPLDDWLFEQVTVREKQYWLVVKPGSEDERKAFIEYWRGEMEDVIDGLGSIS